MIRELCMPCTLKKKEKLRGSDYERTERTQKKIKEVHRLSEETCKAAMGQWYIL
jgi:hypothetical protein